MNGSTGYWRIVAIGLWLKLAALWGLVAAPLVPFVVSLWNLSQVLAIGVYLVSVVAVDFAGRCLCLAAPISGRSAIVASVGCQGALLGLIGCVAAFLAEPIEMPAALILAISLQCAAALLFTTFLGQAACALGRPDLQEGVGFLGRRLWQVIALGTGVGAYTLLIAAAVALFGLFSCAGLGLLVALPIGALAVAPWLLFAMGVTGLMLHANGSSMGQLRRAMLEHPCPDSVS